MSQYETDEIKRLIARCDSLIKEGKIASVGPLLSRLNLARVPRSECTELAKICRRVGHINRGLRLLHPILRNDKPLIESPTAAEVCEYAVLLSRTGSIDEALELLAGVAPDAAPEAFLYQGFCHVSRWDYAQATPFFERFLKSSTDAYSKLIARVNLAASYVATDRFEEADSLISETIELSRQGGFERLMGNSFELRSQVHLGRNELSRAKEDLRLAQEVFAGTPSFDLLFIRKWQAVIRAIESGSVESILEFRGDAENKGHWESVREADFFALKIRFDQSAFDHVVFGTPHEAYRERITLKLGLELGRAPSETYFWGEAGARWLDLETGSGSVDSGLNPGKKIHQVIAALARDFYAPRSSGALFSELYPGEYFDVNTSLIRIRQAIARTRQWLERHRVPVVIENHGGGYRLRINGPFALKVSRYHESISTQATAFEKLKLCFSEETRFTVNDVVARAGLSRSGFHRLADWALEQGKLEKSGVGKATVYRLRRLAKAA